MLLDLLGIVLNLLFFEGQRQRGLISQRRENDVRLHQASGQKNAEVGELIGQQIISKGIRVIRGGVIGISVSVGVSGVGGVCVVRVSGVARIAVVACVVGVGCVFTGVSASGVTRAFTGSVFRAALVTRAASRRAAAGISVGVATGAITGP